MDVFNFNTSTGTANVSTSSFSSNQATGTASGGGINNESFAVNLSTTAFTSNSAGNRGGGIYVGGGSLLLNGTSPSITFTGNTATSGGGSISAASTVNVSGTNTSIGGDLEITTNGLWTNNAGSTLAPTNIVVEGGTFNCSSSTMNVSGNLTLRPQQGAGKGGTFNADTGVINIAGDVSLTAGGSSPATSFNAGTGTVNFNGGTAQGISGTLSPTFNNLVVTKTGGSALTLSTVVSVASNLTVTSGVFDLGTNTANRTASGGTLTVSNGGTLKIGGTNTLPSNYSAHSIGATSTIEYSGSNQTVATLNSSQKYGNLTISGSGTKTLQGAIGVATNLTINAGTLDVSASNFGLSVGGDFTNNVAAANFNARSGTVTFNGLIAQNINGTSPGHTFNSLTSNRTGTGNLSLGSTATVNGLLTLTSGNISTGANTLSIGSAGTRSRTSGYILGNEKKTYAGNGSFTFDVGPANGYSPVDANVTAGTGDLTVLAVQGAQPSTVSSRSLQRYWTLTEGGAGITANLVFHYLDPTDISGNEANYRFCKLRAGRGTISSIAVPALVSIPRPTLSLSPALPVSPISPRAKRGLTSRLLVTVTSRSGPDW